MSNAATGTGRTAGRWLVFALALVFASVAQAQDRGPEVARLMQKALAEGTVPVIVRLSVAGLDALTTASAAATDHGGVGGRQLAQQQAADALLTRAIDGAADQLLRTLPHESWAVNNRYASVPFLALRVSADALTSLYASPVMAGVEEDVRVELIAPEPLATTATGAETPHLDGTVDLVGASTAWRWGFTGAGWYIAILDTGIRPSHEFFAGKTIVEACFSKGADGTAGAGDCPNGQSTQTGAGSAAHHPSSYAGWDHGTHVAGIAAGNAGSLSGIARHASLIALQVFSRQPASSCSSGVPCVSSWNSDSLAALDWIYTNRGSYRTASANMSLGGGLYTSPCDGDSRKAAIDQLRNAGIATAIAAGNDGACGRLSAPGCISSAIAVAASTDADNQASFSNWHTSMVGLFAPGASVRSATGASDTSYASWNGTSMATPHVAGAWALMKQVVSNG
ncbi:MAG: S8 family serine peptidase, partial [Vicinamibacterales bacterium]|nr:S8 family serine peptidase [Vicinamibacterales bacterium]